MPTNEKGRALAGDTTQKASAGDSMGITSPRQLRALVGLLAAPNGLAREELDRTAGCSNGPDLIANLRAKGLHIPCEMRVVIDRDDRKIEAGFYSLAAADRPIARRLVALAAVAAATAAYRTPESAQWP